MKYIKKVFPILWFIFCFLPFSSRASEFIGQVIRVLDGDTIEVKTLPDKIPVHEVPIRVRLINIDAPEKNQAYGPWSGKQLKSLVGGKSVRVEYSSTDRFGRILGRVLIDGTEVNRQMVILGAAWVYEHYNTDSDLSALQHTAQQQKRGLWADSKPVSPWEWRHSN